MNCGSITGVWIGEVTQYEQSPYLMPNFTQAYGIPSNVTHMGQLAELFSSIADIFLSPAVNVGMNET